MGRQTIILIDDDETLLELLSDHVHKAGYRCLTSSSGAGGLQMVTDEHPDLVVLDVMMPGMNGWEVCKQLRQVSSVSIIMLTAKGEEIDKLYGFRLGVDDYVTKPFSFAELMARIGAVLARSQHRLESGHEIVSGELKIDFDQHRVSVGGSFIDLTRTEYRLLETLARHPNRIVPTERLLEQVWGPEYQGQIDQIKHYIWSLRRKIERDPGDPEHIITERGFGYRFQ